MMQRKERKKKKVWKGVMLFVVLFLGEGTGPVASLSSA